MNHADSSIGLSVSKLKLCPRQRMLFAGNLFKHPCFDEMKNTSEGYRLFAELENTDTIMNQSFWIGVYPRITNEMIEFIIREIRKFMVGK